MPSGPRSTGRPGAGPGRGRPRAGGSRRSGLGPDGNPAAEFDLGTDSSPPGSGTEPADLTASGAEAADNAKRGAKGRSATSGRSRSDKAATKQSRPQRTGRRPSLTARAVALAVVILMLTISYANSLRIYFAQSQEMAATKTEIAERQARINDLQTELNRWNDPEFVRLQARSRLGWVMPGEIGFTVVDKDGNPLGGGAELSRGDQSAGAMPQPAWYAKLWGSVQNADRPPPPEPDPADAKPITEKNVDDAQSQGGR